MRAEKQRNAGIHLRSNNSENTLSALCDITMIFLKSAYSVQLQSWMVVASQKEKKKAESINIFSVALDVLPYHDMSVYWLYSRVFFYPTDLWLKTMICVRFRPSCYLVCN